VRKCISHHNLPVQWKPSPENPELQEQVNQPTVLVQLAFEWQLWVPIAHSSISAEEVVTSIHRGKYKCSSQTHLTLEDTHVNCKHTKWKVNRTPGSVKTSSESFSALKGKLNRSV